jgi:hypothetical protein
LSVRCIHFEASRSRAPWLVSLYLAAVVSPSPAGASSDPAGGIHLELTPRVCTLAPGDERCDTRVQASWKAPRDESLCLVIVDRPDVKRCWEHYSAGTYSIQLVFSEDLVFQLRNPDLQQVLASEALRVIREAIRYRRRRRDPWNIFG